MTNKKHTGSAVPGSLTPYLSERAAWALSVGTSVGWGALVVTSSDFLSAAGPAGSLIGLLIGMGLMLLIARNYFFTASRYPDAGGLYSITKNVFGYDRAFLVFWFMSLVYLSMFWANATSLPLFARYFIGYTFRFGYLYTVFGYEIYLGEVLLTLAAILLVALLCIRSKRAAAHVMVILVLLLLIVFLLLLATAIVVLRKQLAYLVDDPERILLVWRERFLDTLHLKFLELRGETRYLRLVLGREWRLVGVALRLLLVGTRPRRELRAESTRVVERILLPAATIELLHVEPCVRLRDKVFVHRRRRHHRELHKPREVVLCVREKRIRLGVEIRKPLRRILRLLARRVDLRRDRRRLLLVRDRLRDKFADGDPRIRKPLRALRKRVCERNRLFSAVCAIGARL